MQNKFENLIVIKIGGSTLGQHDTTLADVVELQKEENRWWSFTAEAKSSPNG